MWFPFSQVQHVPSLSVPQSCSYKLNVRWIALPFPVWWTISPCSQCSSGITLLPQSPYKEKVVPCLGKEAHSKWKSSVRFSVFNVFLTLLLLQKIQKRPLCWVPEVLWGWLECRWHVGNWSFWSSCINSFHVKGRWSIVRYARLFPICKQSNRNNSEIRYICPSAPSSHVCHYCDSLVLLCFASQGFLFFLSFFLNKPDLCLYFT